MSIESAETFAKAFTGANPFEMMDAYAEQQNAELNQTLEDFWAVWDTTGTLDRDSITPAKAYKAVVSGNASLIKQRDELKAEVEKLESELAAFRWIPVSERLPERKVNEFGELELVAYVLVTYRCPAFGNNPCLSTALYSFEREYWSVDDAEVDEEMVVEAWMPPPEPYTPQGDE
jgi:hypothetical protein